jgi:hypothetical protein
MPKITNLTASGKHASDNPREDLPITYSVKPLPTIFSRSGWSNRLLKREGEIALYEQTHPKVPDKPTGYVVVIIRERKARTLPNGTRLPLAEVFPSPGRFGKDGWYYMKNSFHLALRKYDHLLSICRPLSGGVCADSCSEDILPVLPFTQSTEPEMGPGPSAA